jgi:hypothetical protein
MSLPSLARRWLGMNTVIGRVYLVGSIFQTKKPPVQPQEVLSDFRFVRVLRIDNEALAELS